MKTVLSSLNVLSFQMTGTILCTAMVPSTLLLEHLANINTCVSIQPRAMKVLENKPNCISAISVFLGICSQCFNLGVFQVIPKMYILYAYAQLWLEHEKSLSNVIHPKDKDLLG